MVWGESLVIRGALVGLCVLVGVPASGASEAVDEAKETTWGRRLSSGEESEALGKLRGRKWYRLVPDGERLVVERHCRVGTQDLEEMLQLEGAREVAWNPWSNRGRRAKIRRVFEAPSGELLLEIAEARKKPSLFRYLPAPEGGGVAHFRPIGSDRLGLGGPWLELGSDGALSKWASTHPVLEPNCTAPVSTHGEAHLRSLGFSPTGSHFAFVDETYQCQSGPMGHACGPGKWARLRIIDVLKNDFVGPPFEAGGPRSKGQATEEVLKQGAALMQEHRIDPKQGRALEPEGSLRQVAFEHAGKRYLLRSRTRRGPPNGCQEHPRLLELELVRRETGEVVTLQRDRKSAARWRRCTRDYTIYGVWVHPGGERPVVAVEVWTVGAKRPGMFVTGALE